MNQTATVNPPIKNKTRHKLYELRNVGRHHTDRSRVRHCGSAVVNGDSAVIGTREGRVTVYGILSCGSVHECPTCRARICAERADEIKKTVKKYREIGGSTYLLTLTIQHAVGDDLKKMRRGIANAWRYVCQGRAWQNFKKQYKISYIRGSEQTHGRNGWHPHLHVLLLCESVEFPVESARAYISERWRSAVLRELGEKHVPRADKIGIDLRGVDGAQEYISKLGLEMDQGTARTSAELSSVDSQNDCVSKLGLEMTQAPTKIAKKHGKTALQILESIKNSETDEDKKKYSKLWRAYAKQMKGARLLTWSRGLKKIAGLTPVADEKIVEKQDKTLLESVYFHVDRRSWKIISRDADVTSRWLTEIERVGPEKSLNYLKSLKKSEYYFLANLLQHQLNHKNWYQLQAESTLTTPRIIKKYTETGLRASLSPN